MDSNPGFARAASSQSGIYSTVERLQRKDGITRRSRSIKSAFTGLMTLRSGESEQTIILNSSYNISYTSAS